MCKTVYLTTKRTCKHARYLSELLTKELRKRRIDVVNGFSIDVFNMFRKHRIYGIAIAFDFYKDDKSGCGLMINKNCSIICRDFSYNMTAGIDTLMPEIPWRDFDIVSSENPVWSKFFKGVSSTIKAVFYLCNSSIPSDMDAFYSAIDDIVKRFADEIVRCLRSEYDADVYRKRAML